MFSVLTEQVICHESSHEQGLFRRRASDLTHQIRDLRQAESERQSGAGHLPHPTDNNSFTMFEHYGMTLLLSYVKTIV